ncbi:Rossmann fold domain-containing protein [Alteriqipengyuania sp. 357]
MATPAPAMIRVEPLPEPALDAAAAFHAGYVEQVRSAAAHSEFVMVLMQPAPFDHADWRRAAARDLARAHPDNCINIVAGLEGGAMARMVEFLARAPAITGQYLPLADTAPCESGSDGRLGDDDTDD